MTPITFADVRIGQVFTRNEKGYHRVKLDADHCMILNSGGYIEGVPRDEKMYAVYRINNDVLMEVK